MDTTASSFTLRKNAKRGFPTVELPIGLKLIDCRFSAVVFSLIVGRNPAWAKVPVDLGRALTTVRQY